MPRRRLSSVERALETFVAKAPNAIAMFDQDMRYLATSPRWKSDYGIADALTGRSHYEVFPDMPEAWREAHRRGLAGEMIRKRLDAVALADGSVQWLNWEVRPWGRTKDGVSGILVLTEDVSQLVEMKQALAASDLRFEGFAAALRTIQGPTVDDAPTMEGASARLTPSDQEAAAHGSEAQRRLGRLRQSNGMLAGLTEELFALLAPHLRVVAYGPREVLIEAHEALESALFPLQGLNAAYLTLEDGAGAEVAIGGHGGMAGVSVLTGAETEQTETRALMAGSALSIRADLLRSLLLAQPDLREALEWFVPALMAQISIAVVCNRLHSADQRLARWLLTASARTESSRLSLSQETIAASLGIRRTGVSEAMSRLAKSGAVRCQRNLVVIVDKTKLASRSCGCFRELELVRDHHLPANPPWTPPAAEETRAALLEYRR